MLMFLKTDILKKKYGQRHNTGRLRDRDTRVYHTAGRSGGLRRYDPIGVLPLKSSLSSQH